MSFPYQYVGVSPGVPASYVVAVEAAHAHSTGAAAATARTTRKRGADAHVHPDDTRKKAKSAEWVQASSAPDAWLVASMHCVSEGDSNGSSSGVHHWSACEMSPLLSTWSRHKASVCGLHAAYAAHKKARTGKFVGDRVVLPWFPLEQFHVDVTHFNETCQDAHNSGNTMAQL